jgi:sugar/nucleoside kinase (ribokinase family)
MRLGVLGTMVWDRIYARDGRARPVEEWGGIAYALAAAAAARPPAWTILPIVKVGRDLEEAAFRFLRQLPGLELDAVCTVPAPNNRVELRYMDRDRRCEQLTGGVPAFTHEEIAPALASLDALYINFISGFEIDLATAQAIRATFTGPIYADLHSLFLGIDATGLRSPRPLVEWREWLRCFDVVQVNEIEMASLSHAWGDSFRFAAEVVGEAPRVLFITLGARGAAYVASGHAAGLPLEWHRAGLVRGWPVVADAPVRSGRIEPDQGEREGDPTGCGDVWGTTCFFRLLAGATLESAVRAANEAAARNVEHRGATGLHHHLQGRLAS